MGANYVAHQYDLSAPWQRAEYGSRFMGVVSGEPSAALAEGATLAVRCKALHPLDCPSDSFRRHASDRGIARLDPFPLGVPSNTTAEELREQLRDTWELWSQSGTFAGTTPGVLRGLGGWLNPADAREAFTGYSGVFVSVRARSIAKDGVEERTISPETWSQYRLWLFSPAGGPGGNSVYEDMTKTEFNVGVKFGPGFIFGFSLGALAKARLGAAIATCKATMPAHHQLSAVIVIQSTGFGYEQACSDALNATPSGGTTTTGGKGYRLI